MLADIELAQTLQATPREEEKVEEVPHPLDRDYQLLKCHLQLLDSGAPEYKVGWASQSTIPVPLPSCPQGAQRSPGLQPPLPVFLGPKESSGTIGPRVSHPWPPASAFPQVIQTYLEQTGSKHRCPALQNIWKVNREKEVRVSQPFPHHHPVP